MPSPMVVGSLLLPWRVNLIANQLGSAVEIVLLLVDRLDRPSLALNARPTAW